MVRFSIAILLVVVLLTSSIITGCRIPPASELRIREGKELYRQGHLDEAIDKYTEASRLEPTWYEPYRLRGLVYAELSQLEQAIKDYDEAIRLDPREADHYNNRGLAYAELG